MSGFPVRTRSGRPAELKINAEVLNVEVVLESEAAALARVAGALDAAERRLDPAERAVIDRHHPVVERLADAVGAAEVAREEVGGEPVLGRVRQRDRLVLGVERDQ